MKVERHFTRSTGTWFNVDILCTFSTYQNYLHLYEWHRHNLHPLHLCGHLSHSLQIVVLLDLMLKRLNKVFPIFILKSNCHIGHRLTPASWSLITNSKLSAICCWSVSMLHPNSYITQYGHSQSEKKLRVGDKYHRSIKVHT